MPFPAKHISVAVRCSASKAYAFASNPENLPQWAAGLSGSSIKKLGDDWVAESPMGPVKIRFAEKNGFGVLDHTVTLESGQSFDNPMRVFPNGDGCEITFALFRQPDATDKAFADDAAMIEKDFATLKALLEK